MGRLERIKDSGGKPLVTWIQIASYTKSLCRESRKFMRAASDPSSEEINTFIIQYFVELFFESCINLVTMEILIFDIVFS